MLIFTISILFIISILVIIIIFTKATPEEELSILYKEVRTPDDYMRWRNKIRDLKKLIKDENKLRVLEVFDNSMFNSALEEYTFIYDRRSDKKRRFDFENGVGNREYDKKWHVSDYNNLAELKGKKSLKLKEGSNTDYFIFLNNFIKQGGKITGHSEYPLSSDRIYIAEKEFEILPLYGSNSITVIIMPGCKIIDGDPGHSKYYHYDDILNQKYKPSIKTYSNWNPSWI